MIFVKAEVGTDEIDIVAFLGEMAPLMEQLDLAAMTSVKRGKLLAAANWKHLLDTYGEGYHLATLHPDTLGKTHHTNLMAYDAFGPHWRVAYPAKSMDRLAQLPASEWPPLDPVVYYIFPNTGIVVGSPQPGLEVIEIFNIFPGDVRTTHVDLELYAPASLATAENRPMLSRIRPGGAHRRARGLQRFERRLRKYALGAPGFQVGAWTQRTCPAGHGAKHRSGRRDADRVSGCRLAEPTTGQAVAS